MNESTAAKTGTGKEPALPHDQDERSAQPKEDGQHWHNRKPIEQGRRDVESGIEDTERIGIPTRVPASNDGRG